jgi:hypothetical protein
MGHLDQVRKNQCSTKVKPPKPDDDSNDVIPSPPSTDGKHTQFVYAAIVQAPNESGQIYTNQTGCFPVTSRRGNKYIMILYDYDSNSILAEPMKSRTDDEIIRSYQALHDCLIAAGLKPRSQKLDNEASRRLKQFLNTNDIEFQLVPPHSHRRNAAERAIRTFKNHFIAGLCSTDKLFPMNLWCRLICQATSINYKPSNNDNDYRHPLGKSFMILLVEHCILVHMEVACATCARTTTCDLVICGTLGDACNLKKKSYSS